MNDNLLPLLASRAVRDWLVARNIRLAGYWATRTASVRRLHYGTTTDDLVGEGVLGLHAAAERFDFARQLQFSTYASWWIRQAIGRFVDYDRTIRPPCNNPELAPRVISIHAPTNTPDRDECTIAEILPSRPDRDPGEDLDTHDALARAMANLTPRQRQVIHLRHFEHLTLSEAANRLRVSKERIRQLEAMALHRMRLRLGVADPDSPSLKHGRCHYCGDRFAWSDTSKTRKYCSQRCCTAAKVGKPWGRVRKEGASQ